MQRNLSVRMNDSTNSNNCTPQQKLRKISCDHTSLDQYINNLNLISYPQQQNVRGWDNSTWNPKYTNLNPTKTTQFYSKSPNNKTSQSPKKISSQRNSSTNRSDYIQRLQQKLIQLVSLKKGKQVNYQNVNNENNNILNIQNPNYLNPRKYTSTPKRTTSTSQSQSQKCQHNFTSNTLRKQSKKQTKPKQNSTFFKIRRLSKQSKQIKSQNQMPQLNIEEMIKNHRFYSKSMLTSYQPLHSKSKQLSIISYPVMEEQKRTKRRKGSKLKDFTQSFYLQSQPQNSKHITNPQNSKYPTQTKYFPQSKYLFQKYQNHKKQNNKKQTIKQNSLLKIKISSPKNQQNKYKNKRQILLQKQ